MPTVTELLPVGDGTDVRGGNQWAKARYFLKALTGFYGFGQLKELRLEPLDFLGELVQFLVKIRKGCPGNVGKLIRAIFQR